ncbi:hypothetical protein LCGC14_1765830 [marine sediment metagenome]|uniref:Uncharacterized protein n=1 Tax=marine sediment metagenome TaxID=412755 RepID=A0A0F9HM86_9ZZZZ
MSFGAAFWVAFFAGSAAVSLAWVRSLILKTARLRAYGDEAASMLMMQHKMLVECNAADEGTTEHLVKFVAKILEGDLERVDNLKEWLAERERGVPE